MAENNPSTYKLFSDLSKDGLYTKSFDEFKAKYSTPEAQAKLHSGLVSDGLYTKSLNDFKSQYFTITPTAQKKNPNPTPQVGKGSSALPSTLAGGKSSSVLPQPKSVSVTPGKSQGALLMAPKKPKTAEDFIRVEQQKRDVLSPNFYGGPTTKKPQQPAIKTPQKVSVGEDLQNRFLSSLSDVASFIGSAPNAADQFSMFVTSKLFGFDEEYNALPIEAKREVANMAKGVYGDPTFDGKSKSLQAVEYFDKKSKEFLEKTNQSDKYTTEKIADLYKDPTVEKATDLFLDIPRTFVSSLPYMINPYLGAVSLATGKYTKEIEEDQGKLGWGQVINAGVTGLSEYYIEKISRGVLNRSVRNALGLPEVAKKVAEGWVKSVLKDITWEGAGEGVTELVQSLTDDITNGREINWVETAKRAFDAAIKGGALAAGMRTTGGGLGYLSKKVMSAADTKKVNKNTEAIMDLNSKKGPDNSPQVNAVIESKIKELDDENKNIINSNISKVKSMSDAQLKEIVDIDNSINSIKSNRDAIVADPNLSDTEKQSLLDHLKSQAVALNERKSAVEKQAPLTVDSFNNPDEFGLIKFDFSSENEIPSELKNLTPVQMGTSTDKDGNKKIFRSYSVDQINPIIDAIQKQTTSQVPVQPEAGTGLQVAEGEPQAKPQGTTQEGKREEIERRRQEELAPYASQTTVSEETFEGLDPEGNPVVYVVRTMADGSRQVRLQLTTDGKVETLPIGKAGKDITFSNAELIEKSYASEPKSISINNNPVNPTKINKINEKYDAELAALEQPTPSEPEVQEVETITANIPQEDLPKVMDLVDKIERGIQASSPEDLQTQQNYAKEVEALLKKRASDTTMPTISAIDVTKPVKFKEGEMPQVPVEQIDWEASGMGNENDAIDKFGGINDITVVDVRGKNANGQYEGKVRVTGQDSSREGIVVFNDPNAPKKPKAARKNNLSPELTEVEKVLSNNGVYPSYENIESIAEIAKSKAGKLTAEDIQSVVKVYNKKAKAIADAFNKPGFKPREYRPDVKNQEDILNDIEKNITTAKYTESENKRLNEIEKAISEDEYAKDSKNISGVKYSDIFIGNQSLTDILDKSKLSIDEKSQIKEIFKRNIGYFKFNKADEQKFLEGAANSEDAQDIYDALSMLSVVEQSNFNYHNTKNYENVKTQIDYIVSNPEKYSKGVVNVVSKIKEKLDNPRSSMDRLYAIDVMGSLGIDLKTQEEGLSEEEIDKLYSEAEKIHNAASERGKQKTNENIQSQAAGTKVAAEQTEEGAQAEPRSDEQALQAVSKREEIKKSLEELKDVGILKSAITGREGISQGEIDAQMALTDAMANVWKETTGRDDFYENFFNEVKQGDIDGLLEKGGVLFQNIELPQRPLTRVSLGVFDLPEFRKMEGKEVAINSLRDLARTRGKQIEKDLMQSTLEYDKYKDAKKISYDEFKSDVEMQVMKLEKIVTSSYASYGADNLGDSDVYGQANTIIYNSPVDHGEYGHFRGDFTPTSVMGGTMTGGFDMSWNDWEIRQIPGTDQYAAIDKSMPDNVTQDQLANYIGTAGTKEQVEKWIEDRKQVEGDINVGLFGHTRVWHDKGSPYYLAELQSDYFQKNDPNDLYAKQIIPGEPTRYSYEKYNEKDKKELREKLEYDLGVGNVLKIKQDKSGFRLFLNIKGEFKEVLDWPYTEGELNTKEEISEQKENARYRLLKQFHEIVHGSSPIPEKFKSNWGLSSSFELQKEFAWNIFDNYNVNRNNLINGYKQEYIKNEIERIKNSEKGVSMLKQFAASQKIHELRLIRESLRNAAQEGAEVLRFPTPYTLAVIEGYVNKAGENGAPYEIVSGDSERLYQGDIIDYGGIEMVVVDANNREITVAPRDEVYQYDYYDFVNEETDNYTDEVRGEIKRSVGDMNNITEADIDNIEFGDLPWAAKGVEDILRNAIEKSETGSISFSDIEDSISDDIRNYLYEQDTRDLFWGDELYSDGDQTYYMVERRGSVENFRQPDEYEEGSSKEDFESQISRDQQTVVNKYKELNKVLKKMRPDAEVVTDENGMEWLETKLTPEDANNPVIAFQEEGGNIKGAVDFSNDNKASVYMFNGADISTLSHEMSGHLGRRFLEQLSSVDEDFAKDYETAKEWAGVKDNQWSTAAEEKWARAFERYLRDGKAPTKALKSVFDNLREWLKNIYKYIKGSSIDIELTPQITKVFDNLLGARSEDTGAKNIPGYGRMMGEVDGIIEKSFNRGVPYMQTMDNAIKYMEKSKVYEDATDIQREEMVREVRKMFKQKEIKPKTAQEYVGQKPTKTTITIDESKELNKRLKALEAAEQTGRKQGYKQGLKESEQVKKDILDYVKSLKVNNKISGAQFKAIVNALRANLLNPVIRKRVQERIDRIIKKANYADQLERSNKLRAAIKKAAKSKTLAANISAMAKKFAKVNPNNVPNVEEYIDMANIVYDSISKPMRVIANENMVNAYSDLRIKEALEAKNDNLEALYNSLVDQGMIPAGMSLKEMQDYILDIEQGKKIEESKQREQERRDALNEVFNALKEMSASILNDGINPLTGEEVELSSEDRQLLKDFTSMDLNKLPIATAYRAQEALMNYIVNGKKFGMRGILAAYQGERNAEIAVKEGLKAGDFRWVVGGSWWGSQKWAKEVESIPGLFTWVFRGRNRGREMMKLMGLDQFMAGAAKGKLDRVKAENEYIAKFFKEKPNGKRFNNINNTYERLVYAYLSRSVDGTPEEKQAEFDRRKRIMNQNVQAMYESRNKELIGEADVLNRELKKAKDAKTVSELKGKFDPINEQAVEFISGKFDEYFDAVDEVAEGIYNLILNKDELYTPDMLRSIVDKPSDVEKMKESVDIPFDLLNKKPAGTMLENKRIQNLPGYDVENEDASGVERILKLDFDASAFNAFEKSLVDAYTAESVRKYSAFVNSKNFKKLFDSAADQKLFTEIVNYYINNERGKIAYKSDWKAFQNFSSRIKSISTYRALGSATAFIKQAASAIVNTSINLSNDPYALSQVGRALKDPTIGDFINRSEAEINLRGAETTADIKSAEKLIRESKYQTLTDVLDVHEKLGRFQMKSLSLGDVPLARASWFGYYVHALKEQGKPYKNIDWSKAKVDKDAAAYANSEISINQNASMPSTMGQLFSSKNPLSRLTAAWLFPFTSFLFNAKSRLKTDITVLTSKLSTAEDKQAAGRSIVATLAEMPAYILLSSTINYILVGIGNSIVGYDEDEEDEKLRFKRYFELAATRILTDLVSPTPNFGDVATVAAFNALLEKIQVEEDMTKEEKMDVYKLFESKPESMIGAMTELLAQPISSTGRRTYDIYKTIDMINGDYYVNDKGQEIEFSEENKKILKFAAAIQIMGSMNMLPSEAESLAKKIVKTIEKDASSPAL